MFVVQPVILLNSNLAFAVLLLFAVLILPDFAQILLCFF
jgi:hypothetical protein